MTHLHLETFPQDPGVYLMKDHEGKILYIGKAKRLRQRIKQYFVPGRDGRPMVPFLTSQVREIQTIVTFSEKEALLLENTLIKQHQPKYNVLLKDHKSFITLAINIEHPWPFITISRDRESSKAHNTYFGPYTSAFAARQTLDLMNRIFKLRQCSDRELLSRNRPCLLYAIKRCLAPCVGKCTKEAYVLEVKGAVDFLKGNDKEVIQTLKKEIEKASQSLEYERAGALYQRMQQIQHITQNRQSVVDYRGKDCDIFSVSYDHKSHIIAKLIYRKGRLTGSDHFQFTQLASTEEEMWESFLLQHYQDKKNGSLEVLLPHPLSQKQALEEILSLSLVFPKRGKKLELLKLAEKNAHALLKDRQSKETDLFDLQETCALSHYPMRIECFDTSNIAGTDLVACMVGFTEGKRDKKKTRLFKVKGVSKSDDYGALSEVLTRHYSKQKENLPDLVLIDGGKGQLNVALNVFQTLGIANIDLISLAKEEGRHDKGLRFEKIFVPHKKDPITLSPRSSALFILQQIRDEAHRVALSYHRKRRSKRVLHTELDTISGIGPKKRKLLLQAFGSVKQIKKATRADLETIKGLSCRDIEAIVQFQQQGNKRSQ